MQTKDRRHHAVPRQRVELRAAADWTPDERRRRIGEAYRIILNAARTAGTVGRPQP